MVEFTHQMQVVSSCLQVKGTFNLNDRHCIFAHIKFVNSFSFFAWKHLLCVAGLFQEWNFTNDCDYGFFSYLKFWPLSKTFPSDKLVFIDHCSQSISFSLKGFKKDSFFCSCRKKLKTRIKQFILKLCFCIYPLWMVWSDGVWYIFVPPERGKELVKIQYQFSPLVGTLYPTSYVISASVL